MIMFEFEHDNPLREIYITEHFNPALLQLQVAVVQPLMHLQDIMLTSSIVAGSLSVLIWATPFVVTSSLIVWVVRCLEPHFCLR